MSVNEQKKTTKKVTIKDVANAAGVSIALVSFAMTNKCDGKKGYRVSKETAARILEIADKLHYQPNNAAIALRSGKTSTIGVILSDISNRFFADIARCIEDYAYKHRYTVLFGSTDENPQKLENLINVFTDKGVDGLIVVPCEGSDAIIRNVVNKDIPVVLLDREVPDAEVSSVVLNNRRASAKATAALVEQGFGRIEMISYSMTLSNIKEREQGYRDCMNETGLAEYINIHYLGHGSLHLINDIIVDAKKRGVEALVFATNTLAIAGMKAIALNGWHIPSDFAMACFDGNEIFDVYDTAVTYVCQPIDKFGAESFKLLMKLIENRGERYDCIRVTLAPEVVSGTYDHSAESLFHNHLLKRFNK